MVRGKHALGRGSTTECLIHSSSSTFLLGLQMVCTVSRTSFTYPKSACFQNSSSFSSSVLALPCTQEEGADSTNTHVASHCQCNTSSMMASVVASLHGRCIASSLTPVMLLAIHLHCVHSYMYSLSENIPSRGRPLLSLANDVPIM